MKLFFIFFLALYGCKYDITSTELERRKQEELLNANLQFKWTTTGIFNGCSLITGK